ncbi:MAG TPA: GNAT family protein [Thermodesulfobacteriota bacterium]|nr:GNAT family protein [Thermodesulfobacteriota bacterium]
MDDKLILRAGSYLELELLREDHAAELFELIDGNREYLKKWLPWLDNNRYLQNTIDFITFSRKQFKESVSLTLAIMYRGKIAGVIGFHKVDWMNHSTSIGYWLGERYQGKGIVTKSCRALMAYGFGSLGFNRIEIRCAPGNSKSRAIPERLGLVEEGTLREAEWLYDHYVDHVVYSMLRKDWDPGGEESWR